MVVTRTPRNNNRAVYTRENKPRLTLAAAYIIRERNYLYEYKLPGQDKPRLEKAVNVDFVPFIRDVRVLWKFAPIATAHPYSARKFTCHVMHRARALSTKMINRAVHTRENKPRLTLAAAYIIRERNYLYEYKFQGQDKPRLEKAVNVDLVPFIRSVRVLCKPRLIFSRINSPNDRADGHCYSFA